METRKEGGGRREEGEKEGKGEEERRGGGKEGRKKRKEGKEEEEEEEGGTYNYQFISILLVNRGTPGINMFIQSRFPYCLAHHDGSKAENLSIILQHFYEVLLGRLRDQRDMTTCYPPEIQTHCREAAPVCQS